MKRNIKVGIKKRSTRYVFLHPMETKYDQKFLTFVKNNHKLLVLIFAGLFVLIFVFINSSSKQIFLKNTLKKSQSRLISNQKPIILHWTPFFHNKPLTEFIRHFPKCKYECIYTNNRQFVNHARAIVFHIRQTNLTDLPPTRFDQLRVFFSREGPDQTWFYGGGLPRPDYFNITINYRSDSDVQLKYGYFQALNGNETVEERWDDKEIDRIIANKTKLAFSAISHCQTYSRREFYLNALRNYINFTSIGRCTSNQECREEYCLKAISAEHFFYFAFENAVCPEYVTEKFFRLYELVVPVVLTRSIMPKEIPPDSYIAASDFESPQKLAEYLTKVASNRTEYKKFFEWTRHYRKIDYKYWLPDHQCKLCELLYKKKNYKRPDYRIFMDKSTCSNRFAEKLASNKTDKVAEEEKRLRAIMKQIG